MTVAYLDELMPFAGEIHPYADRWPMRTADEIEAMAASIAANGLRLPIILTPDGVLVDGRNRLRACEFANVTPTFETRPELTDNEAIASFIWDINGDNRRHMNKGQLAMLAALRPGSARSLSEQTGVALGYVGKAMAVIEFCDEEWIDAVISGGTALNLAYEQAQQIKATVQAEEIAARKAKQAEKERQEREAKQLEDLRTNRPDLADLVAENKLPLREALALRAQDVAKAARAAEAESQAIRNLINDAHLAFTIISGYRHAETVAKVRANWEAQVRDWTATDIRELAKILNAVADQWETQ